MKLFDTVEDYLSRGLHVHPRLMLNGSRMSGRLRRFLSGRWPSADEVHAIFPHLGALDCRRVASEIAANEATLRAIVRVLARHGSDALSVVDTSIEGWPDTPSILLTFHAGLYQGLAAAARLSPRRCLVLRHEHLYAATTHDVVETAGDPFERAASLLRAVQHLRRGGHVVIAPDIALINSIPVVCLGRTTSFGRGPFALARLTGASVVPIVARWDGRRIVVDAGAAFRIAPDRADQDSAQAAAGWLEQYLLDRPQQISLALLRRLLGVGSESVTHAVTEY